MAGRGTDIRLEDGVAAIGGLHVIATEFHEAGRIDRQLFGRCARQGDPGSCRMFFSLDDELFTRFVPTSWQRLIRALIGGGTGGRRFGIYVKLAMNGKLRKFSA